MSISSVQFSLVPLAIWSWWGHQGQFSRDPLLSFPRGAIVSSLDPDRDVHSFGIVHSALPLLTTASPILQGALKPTPQGALKPTPRGALKPTFQGAPKDGFGEAVVARKAIA